MLIIPIIGAQEDISNINDLIAEHDLNDDGIVMILISDNEDGAVLVEYDIYTGEREYRMPRTSDSAPVDQVPGFTVIPALLVIGSLYLIYRGTRK